ncbi:MalY/PatB family protein [Aeribacillus alveayuensis]|uniref:cysteine-S-conjugate beta-lyase n=1 Tax=Aeribacillus alveayuensis TaxID=279215 RepID=A0ABT9VSP7_9BACI|nr:cystathionine beta-lyase [Bacillus alveayuensis]
MDEFNYVVNRIGTSSVKWDMTKKLFGDENVLPMWVADMDFPSPKPVIDALIKRVEHGIFGYTFPSSETKRIIKKWIYKRHGWDISPSYIEFSTGVVKALSSAICAFTEEGDHIVIQPPVYYPFFDMVSLNNRVVVENRLILNNGQYEIDFQDLEQKLMDKKVKMLLLCNPQNPSGRVWTKEELTKIGELCLKYDVMVISDEIHSDLMLFDFKHTPFASIDHRFAENSITCIAPSKTFNLPGLQAAVIIIPNRNIRQTFTQFEKKQGSFSLNTLGITAMEAAYQYGEKWLENLLIYLEENVKLLEEFIQNEIPQLKVIRPQSTYLVWIDCRNLNKSEKELKDLLLNKGKLALELGSKYGKNGEGFVRMNIACPRKTLEDGLNRLKKAFT